MTAEERNYYANKPTIAVCPITQFEGLKILDIIHGTEDYVVYKFGDEVHKAKVSYGNKGGKFRFNSLGITLYLDNCIRYA